MACIESSIWIIYFQAMCQCIYFLHCFISVEQVETTDDSMDRPRTGFQNINQPTMGTASKQESVHIKSHFMTEIVRNKSPVTCFYKQVLVAFWYGMNLWYVGYDMKFICYLTGFAYHKQPFFRYVGPSSCYAMLTYPF